MLPILKKKTDVGGIAGTIIKNRQPDETPEEKQEPEDGLEECAHKIMDAISRGDASALATALKEAINKVDSEPHREGEHTNKPSPHSYDASKVENDQT